MKGVVLAAGKGTRLYPITHQIAKPLLPLANRPTLEYAFDQFRSMGIDEVCVVVGENEPQIRGALGGGRQFGLRLSYARQTEPKGLAHALSFAEEFVSGAPFVLYLGDVVYSEDFQRHAERFLDSDCANLNIVKWVEDPRRFGVANLDGDRIVKLVEKPANPESNYAMAGMYFFREAIWKVLPTLQPSARGEFEITDAIQALVSQGNDVRAGVFEGEWFDTGTLESFLSTSAYLVGGGALIDPAAAVDCELGPNVVVGPGARVKAEKLENTVVFAGARVEGGSFSGCLIAGGHRRTGQINSEILSEAVPN